MREPYLAIILSGCMGMTIGVSLNLYQWGCSKTPPTQNFVSGSGSSQKIAIEADLARRIGSQPVLNGMPGVGAPPAGNSSDPEWYPNPDRPLRPQLAIMAVSDPRRAAEVALGIGTDQEDEDAPVNDPLGTVMKVWGKDDPAEATKYVKEITDKQRKLGASMGLVEGLAEHDVDLAKKWVKEQMPNPDALVFISIIVPYMTKQKAENWLVALPLDENTRELTKALVASIETR